MSFGSKKALCYTRVSTRKQKDDLERQSQVLQNFCQANGMSYEVILDIGSGLNYKKAGLQQLTDAILSRKADCIVLTHRDRLLRFGYELIEYLCQKQGIQILCISQDEKPDSSQELAEDVLAVLTVFSSRLYGKRSHKNKLIVETNRKLFELSTREDHDENEKENKPDP